MRHLQFTAVSVLALAFAMGMSPQAHATNANLIGSISGGSCQLSIPTTDTAVRPKATGIRNEGTTNSFVICAYPLPNVFGLTQFSLDLQSIDGATHPVSCTGVYGKTGEGLAYSSKTISVNPAGPAWGTQQSWYPADFGLSTFNVPSVASVTCNLPPGVSINFGYYWYTVDIGS